MDKRKKYKERLLQIDQDLFELKPLLIDNKSLKENADYLAEFLRRYLPINQLALAQISNEGSIKESAFWKNDQNEDFWMAVIHEHMDKWQNEKDILSVFDIVEADSDKASIYALFPVACEDKLAGALLVQKPEQTGLWSEEETALLELMASTISVTLVNRARYEEYALQGYVFNELMDNTSTNIYVTDVETNEILFMNKAMQKSFGIEKPEGKICWQVLQKGMEGPCPFCPVPALLKDEDEHPSIVWEEENTRTGITYKNYDSFMQWTDGRTVHFQQSVDNTTTRQLEKAAATDELTDLLNRRAGKLALGHTLSQAKRDKIRVIVGMYDVNDLKEVNDTYGHAEGDVLLKTIARNIKECLTPQDYIFRLSGDEFIIVFKDTDLTASKEKIRRARERIQFFKEDSQKPYEMNFCCGYEEIEPGDQRTITEILTNVDEKMYEKKRLFHIQKAEEKYRKDGEKQGRTKTFSYDKEHLYDALVQSTDDYIYVCNMKTNTFRYPKAMVEEFELPGEVVENAAAVWGARVHDLDKKAFLESNQEITDGRTDCHSVEYRAKNRKGEWVWMRCRGHLERDETGEPTLFAGIITNLGKKNKIDHLTGLFNKFEFEEEIERLISTKPDQPIGIMILGMDEFKRINDLYNRSFGDEVIRITSQKIQTFLPPDASVYRMDGDEFGIILRNGTVHGLKNIYGKIYQAVNHQQEFNGKKFYCTLSAGCTLYPLDGRTYLDLIKYAGYSLEYAKNKGKNQIAFFSEEILIGKTRQLDLTELLRESVEQGFESFEVYYQLQVNADTRKIKGAEALARWKCEKYGQVPPDQFIPILEESGLIIPVGKWIFEQALGACARWIKEDPDFVISVNLSYVQLEDAGFIDFMEQAVLSSGVPPANVVVEMTESYIASNINRIEGIFDRIRCFGMKIAMDDFGTGYSSLGILKKIPADIVKIDRIFVKDVQTSHFDLTFIKFIVELCHDVGIEVCLEGVETEGEYEAVKPHDVDFIQGYLFGKPVPESTFEEQNFS